MTDPSRGFMPYPKVASSHRDSGPLSGMTFAVKDLFDVAGYPTSGGQPLVLAQSGIKTRTAHAVQQLLDHGAELVGKTVTDELAYSIIGSNAHFGAPINAASPQRFTGGSSSGSAAVVAHGLVDFALGTDTGGSIRVPASNCGLFGIRPTHGRVSLNGVIDLAPSFDTCGWLSRDAQTLVRVGQVLLKEDLHPLSKKIRLIDPLDAWELAAPGVASCLQSARNHIRESLGGQTRPRIALESFDVMLGHFRAIQGREAWQTHHRFIAEFDPPFGPGVAERFALAGTVTADQEKKAREFRATFTEHMREILGQDGVLLLPTATEISPMRNAKESELDVYRAHIFRVLCMAGLSGFPQVTLPVATHDGAPLGISLVGPAHSDVSLSQIAEQLAHHLALKRDER